MLGLAAEGPVSDLTPNFSGNGRSTGVSGHSRSCVAVSMGRPGSAGLQRTRTWKTSTDPTIGRTGSDQ